MIYFRGVTTSSILNYVAAFLLLIGLLSIDAKPIILHRAGLNSYRALDNKYAVSSDKARRGLHAKGIHHSRSDVALLAERSLVKRGNCFSKEEGGIWTCSSQTPSVAECVSKIQSHGQVGSKISVFYSGLGGAQGLTACKQYFSCHPEIGEVVLWDNIVDPDWIEAQGLAIVQGNPGSNPNTILDPFQKRMSQAFAEATKGDTYVCTPEGNAPNNDFNQDLAWGGWEYPALTRNGDVTRVIRIDPGTSVTRGIWKQGDPETPNAPKG
ncbi:MAG: hypothetical protein L6R39_006366 [Caloplaca ligustica]|nr:MAG: hypothetical protein L6R39_006366 [Caloplaca ligustica]